MSAGVLRAEWTKFRTVPGWVLALLGATIAVIALGVAPGRQGSCGTRGPGSECRVPVGPAGEQVSDAFYFVRQPLNGDGSITVRVGGLTGLVDSDHGPRPELVPWAKAGLIIKAGTDQGAAYAAVMVTGSHGVHMQSNFTGDIAGPASPRWLRLTRTADTVTGAASSDGTHWDTIGTVRLRGLPPTVQAGLFVTSPDYAKAVSGPLGMRGDEVGPSQAQATFDHLDRQGDWPAGQWTGAQIGGPSNGSPLKWGRYEQTAAGFAVSGSGDIAPAVAGAAGVGITVTEALVGTFIGLVVVLVLGALVITAEYRRGMIRTTFAAVPRRGGVLAAKAVVAGALSGLAGVVAATAALAFGPRVLRGNGVLVLATPLSTQVRLVLGTGALFAVAAVLALGIGAILRRGAAAVAVVIGVVVLPYLMAISVLPIGPARWLLRVSPAAAFAVQQSAVRYPQVDNVYSPTDGYFPLPPWAGLGVLCLWAAAAMTVAVVLVRRRDA